MNVKNLRLLMGSNSFKGKDIYKAYNNFYK